MTLAIYPSSPLPADLTRTRNWGDNIVSYDSGESQGDTAFSRPLYQWSVPIQAMLQAKRDSIVTFVDSLRGRTTPFLMKDPDDFRVNSWLGVASGVTAGTLYLRQEQGFMYRPDTTTIASMSSVLSGFVNQGTYFFIEQDTGIVRVQSKNVIDVWHVHTIQYFRKVRFDMAYSETPRIWGIFNTNLKIVELP